ncbi:hypothetical protein VPHD120_0201 [Vibrio phage D120]
MKVNFIALNENMESMIAEHGFYKTANLIALAYELDHITESEGCSLRFMLGCMYENKLGKCGNHFLGIGAINLDTLVNEHNLKALKNRERTDCAFEDTLNGMTQVGTMPPMDYNNCKGSWHHA